ncbi:MAG TPA: GlsB/YeaQ/YmgE family stress response membrane protein [Anaeromyxobacteraceae bacterium]|nr:GlsB/YeaQ/YmgE family stress response membrane protein [Anaeromyxobacteraceae bacterium]
MGLLELLIVGFVAGALARYYMGARKQGVLVDIALGIVGAVAGGFVFGVLGFGAHGIFARIVVAFLGAVAVIAAYRALARR